MPEVALAGEAHCDAVLIGGGDHVVVTDAAAGLDHGGDTRCRGGIESVAEREERVAGADPAGDAVTRPIGGDPS